MRIKCLEDFKDGTDSFIKDDERTVDDDRGERFVGNGFAEDMSGKIKTGDRQAAHGKVLEIQNVKSNQKTSEI